MDKKTYIESAKMAKGYLDLKSYYELMHMEQEVAIMEDMIKPSEKHRVKRPLFYRGYSP